MGKIYTDVIDTFYGGKSVDVRLQKREIAFLSQHLDIFTSPKRLTPYRAMLADETTAYGIVAFLFSDSYLWGLGTVSGQTWPQVYRKYPDPITDAWGTYSAVLGAAGGLKSDRVFLAFHSYMYGLKGGDSIWAGDLAGVAAFTSQACAITYGDGSGSGNASVANGIVTTDDLLLIPYLNKIAKKDGAGSGPTTNWTASALTLPSNVIISDLVEIDSNTIAVATRPQSGVGKSTVFLWDKVNTDPYDFIDFGEGQLMLIGLIDSELVGLSYSSGGILTRLMIRAWSGGKARMILEVPSDDTIFTLYGNHTKVQDGSRIHFGLRIKIDGTTYHQLAVVGRVATGYPLAFTLAQKVDNDVAITQIDGVGKYGDFFFVAHNANGSVNRTENSNIYTPTALYISQKLNGERQNQDLVRKNKKLTMCGVVCAPLPSGATISLYVRRDDETSWTLVRSYATTNGMGFEAGIKNDGTDFGAAKEFQFKITIVGSGTAAKGEPVALVYSFEDVGADITSP